MRRRLIAGLPALALLAVGLGAAPVAPAGTVPAHAARITAVGVSEREYRITSFRRSVRRGTVKFNVTNRGEDAHDFAVLGGGRTRGHTGEIRAGRRATLRLRLAPGSYKLICTLTDHAQQGMRLNFRVTT